MPWRRVTRIAVGLLVPAALLAGSPAVEAKNRELRPGEPPPERAYTPVKAGGGDCSEATDMNPATPGYLFHFADTDNTCGATNKVDEYNNFGSGGPCNTVGYPGPDLIYRFTAGRPPNSPTATLTPTAPADLGVFVLSDCMDGTSCIHFDDQIGGGAVSTVPMSDLPQGDYWVYVDSYYTSGAQSCGQYTLTLTEIPVELMTFTVE